MADSAESPPPDEQATLDLGASRGLPPSPQTVVDLAASCVRFVQRALGVRLDYRPETLPLLDHWLRGGGQVLREGDAGPGRPAATALVAHAAGAYLGEVVRRRHASWWRAEGDDPSAYRIELRDVYLSFNPVDVARDALGLDRGPDGELLEATSLDLDDGDREAVASRLAELPEVTEEEYRAPSTRLEVLDIAVEAIRQKAAADEAPALALEPDDYGPTYH
jgi:hypothetical protein